MALQHGPKASDKAPSLVTSGLIMHLDASNPSSLGSQNFFRVSNNPTNTSYWGQTSITVSAVTGVSLPTDTIYPTSTSRSVYKISETAVTDQHVLYQSLTGTTTLGKVETISGYFKAGERSKISLTMHGEGYAIFDLTNGTYNSAGGSNIAISIAPAGNGWYYCSATFARTNTTRSYYILVWNGTNNYAGTAGSGVYYYDAQVKQSPALSGFTSNPGTTELTFLNTGTTWVDLAGTIGNVNIQNRNTDWTFRQDGDTGVWGVFNESNRAIANTPSIQIPMNTGFSRAAGTLDFWVKPMKDHTGAHGFFASADSLTYTNANGWLWFGGWDQNEYLYARGNATTCCDDVAFGGFTTNYYYLNSWINLSLTWNVAAGRMTIYKNGKVIASRSNMPTNIPTTVLNNNGYLFMTHTRDDNVQFKGFCNNYRIYNRELSDAEILQNFVFTSQRFR